MEVISLVAASELANRLAQLDFASVERAALDAAARMLEATVKQTLSHHRGDDHAMPWQQSGALHDSISHRIEGTVAVVGSDDPAAVAQEFGTRHLPSRSFLGPAAAVNGEAMAMQVAGLVAESLGGR